MAAPTLAAVLLLLVATAPAAYAQKQPLNDAQVKQQIIDTSIAQYMASGRPCACPYNTARNGTSCGGRSAYSRPGGASPLCYAQDVTEGMVADWRKRNGATR